MRNLELTKDGDVFVLTMINGEQDNTFSLDVVNEWNQVLDELENSEGNTALVITSNDEKSWSTGIRLDWLMKQPEAEADFFVKELKKMIMRVALLNMPTVACITGNCYAAAAILASGMDFRLMRSDRGRFCFPEVTIKIPFGALFTEIISLLPNRHALNQLAMTGTAMGGTECLPKQVVDAIYSKEELPKKAMELAQVLAGKDRKTYTTIKRQLRQRLVDLQASGKLD